MEGRAERRLVTCVFIDIAASTVLTRDLGAERMRRLVDDAFGAMRSLIATRGGTVEKFIGDAVFALFGAPVAHADDPERALRAASECAEWARERASRDPLAIRIGVETGLALVDVESAGGDRERMAVGDCVNFAARLQSLAEPGEILVGPNAHAATQYVAEFAEPRGVTPKGFAATDAWPLRRVVGGARGTLPFVGRERELELLREAFNGVSAGHAKLTLIIGPPGQGKSRLAAEVVGPLRESTTVLEARCRPGEETGALTPLMQLLVSDIAEPSVAAIEARLADLGLANGAATTAPAIAHSVGLLVDPIVIAEPRLEQREMLTSAWRSYFDALAARRPLIVWIEDVHWADPLVLRLIDRISDGPSSRVMVLATARPEFAGSAHFRPSVDRLEIELGPLATSEAAALARSASPVDDEAIGRAQGNPLFIVELARARLASPNIPLTVQAVIGARLDELPTPDRELLQRAAVAGEAFNVRDSALLSEREPAEVAAALGRLAHLRFIEPAGRSYRFHHVLVHDVAYGRLTAEQRLRLHARYAREGLGADDVEALAHHWWSALGDPEANWVWAEEPDRARMRREALRVLIAASSRLIERNAHERALEISTRALSLADEPGDIAEAEVALAMALHRNARGDEAWAHRVAAIDAYRRAGVAPPPSLYADMLEIPFFNFGYFRQMPTDAELTPLLREGERVARAAKDDLALARILAMRAMHDRDLSAASEASRLIGAGTDEAAFTDALARLAQAENLMGHTAASIAHLDEALARAGRGMPLNEPEALMWRTLLAFHEGDLAAAERHASRLFEMSPSRSAHTQQHALGCQALVLFGRGDWDRLSNVAEQVENLVDANPTSGFCLVGAAALGQSAAGDIARGRARSSRLEELVDRMVAQAASVRASVLMLPSVMSGDREIVSSAARAYDRDGPQFGRQVWDSFNLQLALSYALLGRWDDLRPILVDFDERASVLPLLGALAEAIREHAAVANGGPSPAHARLRALGYHGLDELLAYRPPAN